MTPEDLRALLERLTRGPVIPAGTARHVYLWHGDLDALARIVPPSLRHRLDLYALIQQMPQAPYATDKARQALRAEIENYLQQQSARYQVLIVDGCSLLARYGVPLQPFYAFVSDCRVVILVVSRQDSEFTPAASLPESVKLDQTVTLTALRRAVGERNVVQG